MKICNTCYRMQGVDTGEAESSFTAEEELKKIKCNNCGKFRLVPYPEPDIIYCCTCGKKIDKKPECDPWLWKGCVCEVWNDDPLDKFVMYLSFFDDDGTLNFCMSSIEIDVDGGSFKNYRVLGTPLDFAPDWATKVMFDKSGSFRFYNDDESQFSGLLPWPNCPEHLKGMTLPIPDWARNGGGE